VLFGRPRHLTGRKAGGVSLLGGIVRMLANPDAAGPRQDRTADHVLLLLREALQIIDDWDDCPDIGARLQHVIDCVEERSPGR